MCQASVSNDYHAEGHTARRPHPTASFVDGTVLPGTLTVASTTFTVTGMNLLENTARSWYDAGYINLRRRYSSGLSLVRCRSQAFGGTEELHNCTPRLKSLF